jgi:hypothetical protein
MPPTPSPSTPCNIPCSHWTDFRFWDFVSLAPFVSQGASGRNLGLTWVASSDPHPPPASISWGRVGHKSHISPPSGLSPSLSVPSRAGGGQRKQSAPPAPSLPHFLLWEDGLLPPRPGVGPSCQVSPAPRIRGSAWAQAGPLNLSSFHTFYVFLPIPQPSLSVIKICSSGGRKIQWKEDFLGGEGHTE